MFTPPRPRTTTLHDLSNPTDLAATASRLVRRHRRSVVAGLLTLAAVSALSSIASHRGETAAIVVAARDLPAGHQLEADDLAVVDVDPSRVPESAGTDPTAYVGRRLSIAIDEREALTPARIMGATTANAKGRLITTIRLADPQSADVVATGDVIDVMAARTSGADGLDAPKDEAARIVASGIRVAGVPRPAASSSRLLSGSDAATSTGLLLVEVDRATAARLAGAAATSRLSIALRPAA